MNGFQRRVGDRARANERRQHGDNVDGELKLEELRDAVVNISSPHDRLYDACKIVVGKNNVARLLCDVCARNSLQRISGPICSSSII